MKKTTVHILLSLLLAGAFTTACASKGNKKEVEDLQKKLEKESNSLQDCSKKSSELGDRVKRLENAIKKIKEQPCEFDLDPVTLEVKKREEPRPSNGKTSPRPARRAPGPPLNPKKVAVKVRSARRIMKRCYEEAAKRNNALASSSRTVTMTFNLLNSGKVGWIKLKPFVGSGFDKCVKKVVRSWRFDRFGGFPKTFKQRIHLTPK